MIKSKIIAPIVALIIAEMMPVPRIRPIFGSSQLPMNAPTAARW